MSNNDNVFIHVGIWVPGTGWLKCKNDFVSFDDLQIAMEVAQHIGMKSKVLNLDRNNDVNLMLQDLYLENEKRALWNKMRQKANLLSKSLGRKIHN